MQQQSVPDLAHPPASAVAFLRERLAERKARNPAFSLRAMAKTMKISSGTLSELLAARRPLTARMALRIAERLALSPEETLRLAQSSDGSKAGQKARAKEAVQSALKRVMLDADRFNMIAEWHHFAILNLTKVGHARADAGWIARRLSISETMAADALERLKRMGLIAVENGAMRETTPPLDTYSQVPSAAIRRYHAETLRRAETALHNQPVDERHFSALSVAINPSQLPRAKKAIDRFRWEIDRILDSGDAPRERVYTLAIQLFAEDTPEDTLGAQSC